MLTKPIADSGFVGPMGSEGHPARMQSIHRDVTLSTLTKLCQCSVAIHAASPWNDSCILTPEIRNFLNLLSDQLTAMVNQPLFGEVYMVCDEDVLILHYDN